MELTTGVLCESFRIGSEEGGRDELGCRDGRLGGRHHGGYARRALRRKGIQTPRMLDEGPT